MSRRRRWKLNVNVVYMFPEATVNMSFTKCQTWRIKGSSCPIAFCMCCRSVFSFFSFTNNEYLSFTHKHIYFSLRYLHNPEQSFYPLLMVNIWNRLHASADALLSLWEVTRLSHVSAPLPPSQYVLELCKLCASRFLLYLCEVTCERALITNRNTETRVNPITAAADVFFHAAEQSGNKYICKNLYSFMQLLPGCASFHAWSYNVKRKGWEKVTRCPFMLAGVLAHSEAGCCACHNNIEWWLHWREFLAFFLLITHLHNSCLWGSRHTLHVPFVFSLNWVHVRQRRGG